VAEINAVYCGIYCLKYWQKIMKIGEILKQMYFRRKPSHTAVSSQPAKPVSVSVTPRRTYLVSKGVCSELPKLGP